MRRLISVATVSASDGTASPDSSDGSWLLCAGPPSSYA
eukprot:CAMPEP_0173430710 /NCGR_PEP_ID=MMETSP1357-20121228/9063_1 /TAXON_ID=77926 /ORGANISM="Hemiselmis rufescens, Strain PCC563" /LENGTH=37 /DNA_ID= /DNA_START= /DNA_END= /DNA_ORIENTATION=